MNDGEHGSQHTAAATQPEWPRTGREEREQEIREKFYEVANTYGWEAAVNGVAWALAKADADVTRLLAQIEDYRG